MQGILGNVPPDMLQRGRFSHRYFTRSALVFERSPRTVGASPMAHAAANLSCELWCCTRPVCMIDNMSFALLCWNKVLKALLNSGCTATRIWSAVAAQYFEHCPAAFVSSLALHV